MTTGMEEREEGSTVALNCLSQEVTLAICHFYSESFRQNGLQASNVTARAGRKCQGAYEIVAEFGYNR